jgi:glutaredoxin
MEILIYTNSGCHFCKQTKERLDENGYTYKEYTVNDNPEVWHKVKQDALAYMFPTLKVNGRYLMPSRDFMNPGQLITVLEDIEKYGNERDERIFNLEMLKNIHFQFVSTQQVFGQMMQKLNKLEADLTEIKEIKGCTCKANKVPDVSPFGKVETPPPSVTIPNKGEIPIVGGPEITQRITQ